MHALMAVKRKWKPHHHEAAMTQPPVNLAGKLKRGMIKVALGVHVAKLAHWDERDLTLRGVRKFYGEEDGGGEGVLPLGSIRARCRGQLCGILRHPDMRDRTVRFRRIGNQARPFPPIASLCGPPVPLTMHVSSLPQTRTPPLVTTVLSPFAHNLFPTHCPKQ